MAGNDDLSKQTQATFEKLNASLQNAARNLDKATDELSKKGVDKLTSSVKDFLAAQKLVTKEHLASIKDMKSLGLTLEAVEANFTRISKAEEKLQDQFAKAIKDNKIRENDEVSRRKISSELRAEMLDELKLTEEQVSQYKDLVPLLREHVTSQEKLIRATDRSTKEVEGWGKAVEKQVAQFATWGFAAKKLSEAFFTSYDHMVSLSQRGLVGSFGTLTTASTRLMLNFKELEDIINRNRDLVNTLGGGVEGVKRLTDVISDASSGLEDMGKEGYKAGARLVEVSKNLGLTIKDGKAYNSTITGLKKQFKEFSGVFGDSFEDYSQLIELQANEEHQKARLNALSKEEIPLFVQELQKRTENLKLMGLSNTQIVEFNKQLEEMYDPRKNNQVERASGAVSFTNQYAMLEQLMKGLGANKELSGLQQNEAAARSLAHAHATGRKDQVADILAKNPRLAEAFQNAYSALGNAQNSNRNDSGQISNAMFGLNAQNNPLSEVLTKQGQTVQTAGAQGKDLSKLSPEERAKVLQSGGANAGSSTFGTTSQVYEGINRILENPLTKVAMAATAAAAALLGLPAVMVRLATSGGAGALLGGGGKLLGKGLGGGLAAVAGGMLLDVGSSAAGASGHNNLAAGLGIGSSALSGAGTGAMIGSVVPGIGTAAGAAIGGVAGAAYGLYNNWGSFGSGSSGSTASGSQTPGILSPAGQSSQQIQSSGSNTIAKVLQTGDGFNVVARPDGSVVKQTGTRAWRNNNPGNIEYGPFSMRQGAIGSDGRFAIFPDYETGRKAKENLIFGGNYQNMKLTDAVARYAPASENNTGAYQRSVLSAVGGQNKRMSDYSPSERSAIMNAMQNVEGYKTGTATQLSGPTNVAQANTVANPMFAGTGATGSWDLPGAASAPTAVTTAPQQMSPADLLAKQVALLAEIAKNTKPGISKTAAYSADPATVSQHVGA